MADSSQSFRILVVDQFSGMSPYWLKNNPCQFEALVAEVLGQASVDPKKFGFRAPYVATVTEESYRPEMATTSFRAKADGMAEVWKSRWDSSG